MQRANLGDFVYPGHPLVLAWLIVEAFGSFEEAATPTAFGWAAALGDARIPGAGDHVGAAVDVLAVGSKGGSVDEMVAHARDYWDCGQAGGHVRNVEAGRAQANLVESLFRERWENWGH